MVIPKTGTTAMKLALAPVWRALSALNNSSAPGTTTADHSAAENHRRVTVGAATLGGEAAITPQGAAYGLPFMAGDCGAARYDGVQRCVGNHNFPCLAAAATARKATTATTPAAVPVAWRCHFHPPEQHLAAQELLGGFLGERGVGWPRLQQQEPHGFSRMPRALIVTVLREPAARAVSEFHHWQRGW